MLNKLNFPKAQKLQRWKVNTKAVAIANLLRPRQAIKSLLILVAPIAAGQILNSGNYIDLFFSLIGFTLVASSIYVLNDVVDANLDRNHPKKRFRPIASGAVRINEARIVFALSISIGLIFLIRVNSAVATLTLTYILIQISYILWLKHIAIIEIFCVSSGFLIRTLVGAAAISAEPSAWLLAIVSSGALTIVTGKRLSEKNKQTSVSDKATTRPVLINYSHQGLASILTISAGCAIVSYISWALQPRFNSDFTILLSAVTFTIAILAYINIAFAGEVEEPERDLNKAQIIFPGVLTLVLVVIGVAL